MASRILRTALPPAATAEWYSRTRSCVWCPAEIQRRRELPAGPVLDTLHSPRCPAVLKHKEAR